MDQDGISSLIKKSFNLIQQERFFEAKEILQHILETHPTNLDSLHLLGAIALHFKHYEEAVAFLKKALTFYPNHVSSLFNLGIAFQEQKLFKESVLCYQNAILLNSNHKEALTNLGNVLKELGELEQALNCYNKAIEIDSCFVEAWNNKGNILKELGRNEDAINCYSQAILIKPSYSVAYNNRGIVFRQINSIELSLIEFKSALKYKNDNFEALCNLGNSLKDLERYEEAISYFIKAIAINPSYSLAFHGLGHIYQLQGKYEQAIEQFKKGLVINGDMVETQWNLSLCYLTCGNFKDGWLAYESRWRMMKLNNIQGLMEFNKPLWLGKESLKNKTILIWEEQGIGDVIQFCRYLPLLFKQEARVIVAVSKKLVGLIRSLGDCLEVCELGGNLPEFDYHCPFLSLPLAFETSLETIPNPSKYLFSNRSRSESLNKELIKLISKKKKKVGISWKSKAEKTGKNRSININKLLGSLSSKNFQYINLQYGEVGEDIEEVKKDLGLHIIQAPIDLYEDVDGLTSLIDQCDMIISIDNTTVHLAGALGKDTRLLLPFNADWRWLTNRTDSPWYPTLKIYRQDINSNWTEPLLRLNTDLQIED